MLNFPHFQTFAGGPLSQKCGDDLVAAGVKITSLYAATEIGLPTPIFDPEPCSAGVRDPMDWEWVEICDDVKARWDPQGDGSFELQILV